MCLQRLKMTDRKNLINNKNPNTIKSKPVSLAVGCCPRGDPNGRVFRDGSLCCGNEIYNTSTHICCHQKNRVLPYSRDSIKFCYGKSCKLSELDDRLGDGLNRLCSYDKLNNPTKCHFTCPLGTQVKGSKISKCVNGIWKDVPTCCEGCSPFRKLNLHFIVDFMSTPNTWQQVDIKTFILSTLSYFPVKKDNVWVSMTSYNGRVLDDERSWGISEHKSYEDLVRAINGQKESFYSITQYIYKESLLSEKRKHIENVFILIASYESFENGFGIVSKQLEKYGQVFVVSVGEQKSKKTSLKTQSTKYTFVETYQSLNKHRNILFENLCLSNC